MKLSSAFALFAVSMMIISCSSLQPAGSEPGARSAIIFIPGYYGTALKDAKTGERFFITPRNYFFGSRAVSLHVDDLRTPDAPDLVIDGVMDKIPLAFGLFSYDIYGKFMDELREVAVSSQREFVPFAYDWRQDLSESAQALSGKINELRSRGITRVDIVAHSMGCLVATYYLAYGDQAPETAIPDWRGATKVDRAVLMAGPFGGAFSLFRNMQIGAKIGNNKTYMPAETVASLPASYQLLPFNNFYLLDAVYKKISFPLDDVDEWQRRDLGLLGREDLPSSVRARRRAFVKEQLARGKLIAKRLDLQGDMPASLKVLHVVGRSIPTVSSAFGGPNSSGSKMIFDTDTTSRDTSQLLEDGDGSVTVLSARLPPAFRARTLEMITTLPHEKVFEDEAFKKQLRDFL